MTVGPELREFDFDDFLQVTRGIVGWVPTNRWFLTRTCGERQHCCISWPLRAYNVGIRKVKRFNSFRRGAGSELVDEVMRSDGDWGRLS